MAVYFAIFQILPTFVHELFETMQSSVTRSRTSITKSLPASFKLSIFDLSSESYIKIHCFKGLKLLHFVLTLLHFVLLRRFFLFFLHLPVLRGADTVFFSEHTIEGAWYIEAATESDRFDG